MTYRKWAAAGVVMVLAAVLLITLLPSKDTKPARESKSVLTVTVVAAKTDVWSNSVRADGAIAAWQEAVISAENGNLKVQQLLVEVGDRVKRGQLLAQLAQDSVSADVQQQQAAVAKARATLAQAQAQASRAEQVAGAGSLSEQQVDEYRISLRTAQADLDSELATLSSAQIKLRQTQLVAIDDGVVSSRSAELGSVVAAGTEMFRLIRQGRIEWQAELDAQQIGLIRTGQIARLKLPGGQRVEGRVRLISPSLSTDTSRAKVYVTLPASGDARPGMYASGDIVIGEQPAQHVPLSALVLRDGHGYLYLVNDDNHVKRLAVTTGRYLDDQVEITTALPANARIVAEGGSFLADGVEVRIASTATQL